MTQSTPAGSRYLEFWRSQTSSIHRSNDQEFYRRKAQEHALLISAEANDVRVADFACGAGELLEQMLPLVNVEEASDFSESMLARAADRLAGSDVTLICADGLSHAKTALQSVWTTCGGLNQYLDPSQLRDWVEHFVSNANARTLFMFDCVDPYRFRSLKQASKYTEQHLSWRLSARRKAWVLRNIVGTASPQHYAYLGSASMGFGYAPQYLRDLARELDLTSQFFSSREYEYRYHVKLSKR